MIHVPNGEQPQVIGMVQILLIKDAQGNEVTQAKCEGINRAKFLMMMELTKVDLERQLHAQEQQKVVPPPPGLRILRQ
jgi:hypothetical protein